MKNWKQFTYVAIIAIFGIIMGFTACDKDNGTTTHNHEWEWRVTTPATPDADGKETETCITCGQTNGTRTIARIPFTSIEELETWLGSQPENTAETPYSIKLNVSDLGSIGYMLIANKAKYVILDLSGSSFTTIEQNVFSLCTSLIGIIIPNSVTDIAFGTFFASQLKIKSITVDTDNTIYSSQDGILYNKNKTTILTYPSGKIGTTFTIPDSVTNIGEGAFVNLANLTNIIIPNSVISIERRAFRIIAGDTSSITSITFQDTIVADNIDSTAFCGDLLEKYTDGGIGTYTTTAPMSNTSVWTKQ